MPPFMPLFAANPPILRPVFAPGTAGAEPKLDGCGRTPDGSLKLPGIAPPGLIALEGDIEFVAPLGIGPADEGI